MGRAAGRRLMMSPKKSIVATSATEMAPIAMAAQLKLISSRMALKNSRKVVTVRVVVCDEAVGFVRVGGVGRFLAMSFRLSDRPGGHGFAANYLQSVRGMGWSH